MDAYAYRRYIRAVERQLRRDTDKTRSAFYLARYEDLVRDGESVGRDVFAFLGLDFQPEYLQTSYANSAYEQTSGGSGIYDRSLERWRRVLLPHEVQLVESVLRAEMVTYAYQLETIGSLLAHLNFRDLVDAGIFFSRKLRNWGV